eukprot:m.335293 g.335293  ORF g.335293 m.335293 type:complete len:89 (+) comp17563_c0_seq1:48-314(+)
MRASFLRCVGSTLTLRSSSKLDVVVGANYFKDGQDPVIKADSEYPDWLWKVPLKPAQLEDVAPGSKQYWKIKAKQKCIEKNIESTVNF